MSRNRQRSPFSAFSLSFLDIMFCGFGAVVLLVLIVNSQTVKSRKQHHRDLKARVELLQNEVQAEKRLLSQLQNSLEKADSKVTQMQGRSDVIIDRIRQTQQEMERYRQASLAQKQDIRKLQSDLKNMDAIHRRQMASVRHHQAAGRKALRFTGQGHRQYLTGLRLGGRRVLILVDASASMLDSTIVGIIRRHNLPARERLQAPKWRQAVRTARWLLANLPLDSTVRVFTFNKANHPLGQSGKGWIKMSSTSEIKAIASELEKTIPSGGTNMFKAFSMAARLTHRPDNIILLTDGLPTIGISGPTGSRVTSEQRVNLFLEAASKLPPSVPVNTILFPLEGDPMAAAMFWRLAVNTRGAFLTPSSDWP